MTIPWQRVRVSGPSMVPALRHGDTVIVRHGAHIRPGDVVLATFHALPERLVLKRAVRVLDDGSWWLASDNVFAGGDSAAHGAADVHGRVVLRVSRGLPRLVRRPHAGR
jgi:phage repressor protein C with HTH and peptisase S24 domain